MTERIIQQMLQRRAVRAVALLALGAVPLSAQITAPDTGSVPDHQLFHRSDLYVAAGFAAGTVLFFPLDRHLASVIRDEDYVGSADLRQAASFFRFFGGPGPVIIGGTMYVAGRVTHSRRLAEIALHGTEAFVVGSGVTSVLKEIVGRQRPYVSLDTNPHVFHFLKGGAGDFASFPSGHTTAAFSVAAAVVVETQEWWPSKTRYVAPIMYGGAALVGISRMYDDKHWASDVVMGAAIGTFAGLKTVRFNHTHSGNRLDRWLLGEASHISLVPRDGRLALGWSQTFGGSGTAATR